MNVRFNNTPKWLSAFRCLAILTRGALSARADSVTVWNEIMLATIVNQHSLAQASATKRNLILCQLLAEAGTT
jgi:hypothetical protein